MSKATGLTLSFSFFFLTWHIIFHLSNVFPLPDSQPQPIHPIPGFTTLRKIENGWRGTESLIGSIYLSVEYWDLVGVCEVGGGEFKQGKEKIRRQPLPCVS